MKKNIALIGFFAAGALIFFAFQQAKVLLKPNVRGNMTFVDPSHIHGGASLRGTNSFTTSATADTIVIDNITTSSIFVVSINDASPVANDLLSWTVNTDTLFVHRPAGTTSGLAYSYIRID